MIKNKINLIFVILLPILVTGVLMFNLNTLSTLKIITIIVSSILLTVLNLSFKRFNKTFLSKLTLVLNVLLFLISIVFTIFSKLNLLSVFTSISSFKNFILETGNWGRLVYVLVQFAQIIVLPVPAAVITLAGVAIYGPLEGSILCSLGVLLGSYTSFMLGKTFGHKFVSWLAGEETSNKYAQILNDKGKFFLVIAFLLPLFPDDILCLIAGLTAMNFKTFFIIATLTRPISVICMSYFGGGYIIPFSGWGLYVWAVILIAAVFAVVASWKYQSRIETWVLSKIKRKK